MALRAQEENQYELHLGTVEQNDSKKKNNDTNQSALQVVIDMLLEDLARDKQGGIRPTKHHKRRLRIIWKDGVRG